MTRGEKGSTSNRLPVVDAFEIYVSTPSSLSLSEGCPNLYIVRFALPIRDPTLAEQLERPFFFSFFRDTGVDVESVTRGLQITTFTMADGKFIRECVRIAEDVIYMRKTKKNVKDSLLNTLCFVPLLFPFYIVSFIII